MAKKKIVGKPNDLEALTDILTHLTKQAMKQMQTGQIDGRPVTQKDVAAINRARAQLKKRKQPPDK